MSNGYYGGLPFDEERKVFMNIKKAVSLALVVGIALGTAGCGEKPVDYDFTVNYDDVKTANVSSGVSVHDPSILKANGTFYIFGDRKSVV